MTWKQLTALNGNKMYADTKFWIPTSSYKAVFYEHDLYCVLVTLTLTSGLFSGLFVYIAVNASQIHIMYRVRQPLGPGWKREAKYFKTHPIHILNEYHYKEVENRRPTHITCIIKCRSNHTHCLALQI